MFSKRIIKIFILAGLFASIIIWPSYAQEKLRVADQFGANLVFYASFNNPPSVDVDISLDSPHGLVQKSVVFSPGLYDTAVQSGRIAYPITRSLRFDKPGALIMWINPIGWKKSGEDKSYLFFWRWHAQMKNASDYIMFARMPAISGKSVSDILYLYMERCDAEGVLHKSILKIGSTQNWKDGDWHLFVATWSGDILKFSIDAADFIAKPFPELAKLGQSANNATFTIGGPAAGKIYKIDEVMILSRMLSHEENRQLYHEGMEKMSEVPIGI